MSRLKVHLHELVAAFHNGGAAAFYLDSKTGQVLMDYEDTMYDDDGIDIHKDLEEDPGRFIEIDRIGSRETLKMMQNFIAGEPTEEVRDALQRGLTSQRPFQGFRDALYKYPETRKRWYAYEETCVEEMAERWLKEHAVNAKLVVPPKPRKPRQPKANEA